MLRLAAVVGVLSLLCAGCNDDRLPVVGGDSGPPDSTIDNGAPTPDVGLVDQRVPDKGPPPPDLWSPDILLTDTLNPTNDLPPPPPKGLPVDMLFVIDNSGSMEHEQTQLAANFPRLVDALRRFKLGPDGSGKPCTAADTSGCNIPDLRIGVVSTDLGAGNYALPSCELTGGDNGKLQTQPRKAGCTGPSNGWISYSPNTKSSNVPSGSADHIQRVKDAFACIAPLGITGCGFEQTLEAARRAVDPKLNINPGFIRKNALLVVVFITDEDDCSAKNAQLYDPSQQSLSDPLGPLTSFRCFEFGVTCDINDRNKVGPRNNCVPTAGGFLHDINGYDAFFKSLKPPGHVVMGAIVGPTTPVAVGKDGQNPSLMASCSSVGGKGVPAIRIQALVDRFWGHTSNVCQADYGPALKAIGALVSP
jgi:hypothetical protein